MKTLSLTPKGCILFLTENTDDLRRQLEGEPLDYNGQPLVYGVNTDLMISGRRCTEGYTPEILGPYFLEDFQGVVTTDAVRSGDFEVIVGGDAYGSGSSREVAVVAHQGAGINLVVAHSFQRIFQENMVYGGMPFTTDFGVIDRLLAGEEIPHSEFTDSLPPFFRTVAEMGGLLAYASAWVAQTAEPWYDIRVPQRPLNIAEKIIAANAWTGGRTYGMRSVAPGDQVMCRVGFVGMHEYTGGMVMQAYGSAFGVDPLFDATRVACFEDHFVLLGDQTVPKQVREQRLAPAMALTGEMLDAAQAFGLRVHGPGREFSGGVCHRIVVEQYAEPGQIIILTDSHTPTAGVCNAFAFGVGSTATAFALRTGAIPVSVPYVVRVNVTGAAEGGLTPKDLILHLIGMPYFREEQWRISPTDTCIIEFGGDGLEQWNVDELSVLTNMTVEGGLMTGIVEPTRALANFLRKQRGNDFVDQMVFPDQGCNYIRVLDINLTDVPITVATPGDSRNRLPLSEAGEIPVHNVVIASCTGGSLADLRAAAFVLANRSIASSVRVTVTPSSQTVYDAAEAEGILAMFRSKGAVVTNPGCGSCIGNGPGIPLPGETTVSTTNRNFDRRMGAPGPVYLSSPAVAAASAVTGKLTDPRQLPSVQTM